MNENAIHGASKKGQRRKNLETEAKKDKKDVKREKKQFSINERERTEILHPRVWSHA